MGLGVLGAVCLLVIGVYACLARSDEWESLSPNAVNSDYNLLVQGFRAGQLSLKKEVPPGFTRLSDPYDHTANSHYRLGPDHLNDLSYCKRRLYLYFGITPALILFWPFVALTGHYLSHRLAVLVFCTIGFLASVGVLYATWRRYFSDVSVGVVAAGALALGFATVVPVMLPHSAYNEVAISCGYMLTMLALGAIWGALHKTERQCWWLAAASAAYGLAVGARPSLLFGAVILLVPVAQAWRERRRIGARLLAATGPIILIGLGLALYNAGRFDSPFEFGQHYQLALVRPIGRQFFRLRYCLFNFRVYFLEPARWSSHFPFVQDIVVPPLPSGFGLVETPFGILTNIPVVWLALVVPLAWRNRSGREASTLRWFATATALLFGICALTISLFWSAVIRYEVDFAPALVLLAVVGVLGLERVLAGQTVGRRVARWGWGALLSFSVAFNLLASAHSYAYRQWVLGFALDRMGCVPESIAHYEQALRISPDFPVAKNNLAWLLATRPPTESGNAVRAVALAEQACKLTDNRVAAYLDTLAAAYAAAGRFNDAVATAQTAIPLADSTGQTQLVSRIKMRLELYRANRAYYEPKM